MAYDKDETEYTLTEDGWKVRADHEKGIEIWIRYTKQASGWPREQVSWSCFWTNQKISKEQRDKIRDKYNDFMGDSRRHGNRETFIGKPL
jgi:hypothetical protein